MNSKINNLSGQTFRRLSYLHIFLLFSGNLLLGDPITFKEAVFSEVINDVRVTPSLKEAPAAAQVDQVFRTPQILLTGRRSRAQLEAEDGTVTRVGSNTVFSFSEENREIFLKKGSLLFTSPSGKGGGKVVTASAVATVLGTTIMVSATETGGFKVLVLEGRASVSYMDGQQTQLRAGQMTYVLPGEKPSDVSNLPENMQEQNPAGSTNPDTPSEAPPASAPSEPVPGQSGPVINFDLEKQTQSSALIQGFASPLPSTAKISDAISAQIAAIQSGDLEETNQKIVTATKDSVIVTDPTEIATETQPTQSRWAKAARGELILGEGLIDSSFIFLDPVSFNQETADFLGMEGNAYQGIIAGDLTINSDVLNLSGLDLSDRFDIAVDKTLALNSALQLTGTAEIPLLRIISRRWSFAEGSGILEDVPAEGPTANGRMLHISIGETVLLTKTDFYFPRNVEISVLDGDWTMKEGSLLVTGDLNVESSGNLSIQSALISGEAIAIGGPRTNRIELVNTEIAFSGRDLTRISLNLQATDTITLGNVVLPSFGGFRGLETVSMSARTIALFDINFAAGSKVTLQSTVGRLAENPNTNQEVLPGYVNFVHDVNYGGKPAQDFVSKDVGGNATGTVRIEITPGG